MARISVHEVGSFGLVELRALAKERLEHVRRMQDFSTDYDAGFYEGRVSELRNLMHILDNHINKA